MDDGWCECGVALEDPMHYGIHAIKAWNEDAFNRSRQKAMKEFEKRLPEKEAKKWTSLDI